MTRIYLVGSPQSTVPHRLFSAWIVRYFADWMRFDCLVWWLIVLLGAHGDDFQLEPFGGLLNLFEHCRDIGCLGDAAFKEA
jgi:hypothetical protein